MKLQDCLIPLYLLSTPQVHAQSSAKPRCFVFTWSDSLRSDQLPTTLRLETWTDTTVHFDRPVLAVTASKTILDSLYEPLHAWWEPSGHDSLYILMTREQHWSIEVKVWPDSLVGEMWSGAGDASDGPYPVRAKRRSCDRAGA